MKTDEVLTIKEVAALLKLAEKTVYSMAQQGGAAGVQGEGPVADPALGARPLDRRAAEGEGQCPGVRSSA